ncbi:hypothetical protein SORBI_3009G056950 [Sorghum bicolor]|uniref:Uncharacterized protein n=1 Tax=Sorghum bicolor TaxID=4558 RepID=A0A1Z5R246_SORBI|nr:hypothetical protein SORBI_3009G056950 [Sorghum bicolor]
MDAHADLALQANGVEGVSVRARAHEASKRSISSSSYLSSSSENPPPREPETAMGVSKPPPSELSISSSSLAPLGPPTASPPTPSSVASAGQGRRSRLPETPPLSSS